MIILPTRIPDLMIVETTLNHDSRGSFARLFCEHELHPLIKQRRIIQINHSHTRMIGALRGLHFQRPPSAEMKLIRCLKGRVWDVAVDLRRNSPTFLHWHAEELTPANTRMIVIPEGFAHGFQAMESDCEMLYLHTTAYDPACEDGLRHDDPKLQITWPLTVTEISERDATHRLIDLSFQGMAP